MHKKTFATSSGNGCIRGTVSGRGYNNIFYDLSLWTKSSSFIIVNSNNSDS